MPETIHDHEKLLKQALAIIELHNAGKAPNTGLTNDLIAYRDSLKAQNALKKAQLRKLENAAIDALNELIKFGYRPENNIQAVLFNKVNALSILPPL